MRGAAVKAKILSLLKKQSPGFISGEEISGILGISRTAVWKHIRSLKAGGYMIESHSKVGYRLIDSPDRLYQHELALLVKTDCIGRHIVHKDTVGSTNELAKELAQKGAEEGTVVIAEEQTKGKGRMGRSWYSPDGRGLWFTIILRPPICPADAAKLTLVSAVAVAKTIREVTGVYAGIKWPNDVLLDNRKIAGILTEMSAEIDKVNYLVVGIGINVSLDSNSTPSELQTVAASLEGHWTTKVSRLKLLAETLNNFDRLYRDFINGNFDKILSAWKEMSVTINRWVKISSLTGVEEGIAFDVDDEGALLLMKQDGSMKRIISGDISLR